MPCNVLTEDTINRHALKCKYGVRGEIFQRAQELTQQGHPITFTSVGNPHQLKQQPLTFVRQVVALCAAPFLMDDPVIVAAFPEDAVARAKRYLKALRGGLGSYQDSKGNPELCSEICDFIEHRDAGYRPDPVNIFMTNGASEGVRVILQTVIRNESDGILVPIPQYPLYSASIALYGGQLVGYHLDEEHGWGLSMDDLGMALQSAKVKGINVRAIVFINPGNPTGTCLQAYQLQNLVKFAYTNRLVLLADEVYQENVYGSTPFTSCYKVLCDMGAPYSSSQELVSFHTVSKGAAGECGLRGGYFHLHNVDEKVRANLYKLVSINLSPSVPGMVALGCYVNPPKPGDASYDLHVRERQGIIDSLRRRANMMSDAFNSIPGISCQPVDGSMYAFPKIRIPQSVVQAARASGKAPDALYCLELLENAHIAATPGSSFEQEDGSFHFRTNILPDESEFASIIGRFQDAHMSFLRKYGGLEESAEKHSLSAVPVMSKL